MSDETKVMPRRGRPDEVHQACLQAAIALNCVDRSPTLREIIQHARVGRSSGRYAIQHMRSRGLLVICRERKVDYRNRPVAEYAVACPMPERTPSTEFDFTGLAKVW